MSDHLIAEANRHAEALPKMTLPTTKPNDLDLAWYRRECEWLEDRNEVLEVENAAIRNAAVEVCIIARVWVTVWGDKLSTESIQRFVELEKQIIKEAQP